MVWFFKKTSLCMIALITVTSFLILAEHKSIQTSGTMGTVVAIDAGHGDPDGGAVGKSGVRESELNLAVAKIVERELQKNGYTVLMTRTDENAIHTDETANIRNKKRSDLRERIRLSNESGASLLVSIHMNSIGIASCSGPQVFYSLKTEEGQAAADCVRTSLLKHIGSHCTRETKGVKDGIFLLKEATIPSILVECGFLSNAQEESLLITNEYREKMGRAIADGIIRYFMYKSPSI